ncbi:hypothetical protein HYX09_00590 [Candidatus Woesearchaeota archaeon]|nr:hypothetical protein [Candidatus Woesearchaeota archaeon]
MIVFDSSTVILLAKVEILDLLLNNYKNSIVISLSVINEVNAKNTFDALLIKKRVEEGKIEVREITDNQTEKIMNDFKVNIGEAEAMALALDNKGSLLATDDKNAINACKLLNIPFTTSIGILIRAKGKNLLTKEEALAKLEQLSKYGRYKKDIISDAKSKLGG